MVGGLVASAKENNVNKKGENSLRVIGGWSGPASLAEGVPLYPLRWQSLEPRTKRDRPAEGEYVGCF